MGFKLRLWRELDGPIVKQFRVKRSREQVFRKVRKFLTGKKVEDRPSICELFVLEGNCKRRCPLSLKLLSLGLIDRFEISDEYP